MELIRQKIQMNRWKGNTTTQVTLDDDFIVPDTMDDMEQVLLDNGEIQIESVKNQGEKVLIKGRLDFQVLYRRAEGGLQTLGGSIPFEEPVNVPGLEDRDDVSLSSELEDLSTGMVNSRKLGVKAIVTLEVRVESLYQSEAAEDVRKSMGQPEEQMENVRLRHQNMDIAAIAACHKDTIRIKEQMTLSGSKPNIGQLLWKEMRLCGISDRPSDERMLIDGSLEVFVIYSGEGDDTPVQWWEETIPFSGEVEISGADEDMIPMVTVGLAHKDVEARPDYDGEMRELEAEAVLELDIKLYEEQQIQILSDLYATDREVIPVTADACFEQILTKNSCKCRIAEKVSLDQNQRILQICHSGGTVKIDEISIGENQLIIDGAVEVSLLYLTSDDAAPIQSAVRMAPFHCEAEAIGIKENSVYQVTSGLEQLSAVMAGGDSVEIKGTASFDILVLQPVCEAVVIDVTEKPLDVKKLQEMPGIVGYIVQSGDSLWKIAKKFHTTVESIMSMNELSSEEIRPGDRLILVKEVA